MDKENKVSLTFTDQDITDIQAAIHTLETKLLPHLLEITKEEKSGMAKMSDKSFPFVKKSKEYASQKANLVPAFMSVDEMHKDVDGVDVLQGFYNPISQIAKALDDTITVAGSEAYSAALIFYKNVQVASKMNVHGAQEIYDDLRKRFEVSPQRAVAAKKE